MADFGEEIHVCALPFSVKKGKEIVYGTLLHAEGAEMLRNQRYVDVMLEALEETPFDTPNDEESFKIALSMGVADEAGFFLHYEF